MGAGLNRFVLSPCLCRARLCPCMSQKHPWCQLGAGAPAGDTALCSTASTVRPAAAPRGSPHPGCIPAAFTGMLMQRGPSPPGQHPPCPHHHHHHHAAAVVAQCCSQRSANKPAPAWLREDLKHKIHGANVKQHLQQHLLSTGTANTPHSSMPFTCFSCCPTPPESAPCIPPIPVAWHHFQPMDEGFAYVPAGVFLQLVSRCSAGTSLRARNVHVSHKRHPGP